MTFLQTQYGNLLRMEPATQSPLLLPANEHKQLVVIDFEYSSANTPGFEFANHFVSSMARLLYLKVANRSRLNGATTITTKSAHGPATTVPTQHTSSNTNSSRHTSPTDLVLPELSHPWLHLPFALVPLLQSHPSTWTRAQTDLPRLCKMRSLLRMSTTRK